VLAQPLLPLPRPSRARARHCRRPFRPSWTTGPYRLPHDVRDRLVAALASARNRDAALALATFLARFWSTPTRLVGAFPIDRRELADRADLGLTEARVRGAIRLLEEVGFLDRAVASGSTHKLTGEGELHRKPVLYQFGSDYAAAFGLANKRSRMARERLSRARQSMKASNPSRSSPAIVGDFLKSPKSKTSEAERVFMGEITRPLPNPTEPTTALEAALERWALALRGRAG
jgi:hypothetical protein